jgi:hypothetical protein
MSPPLADAAFRAFPQFNSEPLARLARVRARLSEHAGKLFPSSRPADRLARELALSRSISLKELLESFEFFSRVRRRLRAPAMADLCCGHGLTGILFAAFEERVHHVVLLDREQPQSADRLLRAATAVCPWITGKIERVTAEVDRAAGLLPPGTAVLAVHACGARTDRCIDVAIEVGGPIAAMPCCYRYTARMAPRALRKGLGADLASDVARTYRLEQAGYDVDWSTIPLAISPKNRIIVATLPSPRG